MTVAEALEVLALPERPEAGELRRAYLRAVKQHPPERDPAGFQNVRGAFELLSGIFAGGLASVASRAPVVPALAAVQSAAVRSDAQPPDRFDEIRTRCETLAQEGKNSDLVVLLAEHAHDWRARALALGLYGDLLGPFDLGYFAAWPPDGHVSPRIADAHERDATTLRTMLRADPGNTDLIHALVARLAEVDRHVTVGFLLGLDRARSMWARSELLTRFADDVPAKTFSMLVASSPPSVFAQIARVCTEPTLHRALIRIRVEQWRASRADPQMQTPTLDELAFVALLALAMDDMANARELVEAATIRDDSLDKSRSGVLQFHFARAIVDLGDDFPRTLRSLVAMDILEGTPARGPTNQVRVLLIGMTKGEFERASALRANRVLAPIYGKVIYEAGRKRYRAVDALREIVTVMGAAVGFGAVVAFLSGEWLAFSFLAAGSTLCFAPKLLWRRLERTSDPVARQEVRKQASLVTFAALVFWPLVAAMYLMLPAEVPPRERDPLTKQIDFALADSDAHAQMALVELARTEQGQRASSWMTAQHDAARAGSTTWATLLRDWCIVGNLVNTPSVCDRAVEIFPTLGSDEPCPTDLRPFVGTPKEVAAGIGVHVLPSSVDALRESTAGLIVDRCGSP